MAGEYNFPFEIVEVDPEQAELVFKQYPGPRVGFVQVGPKKYFFVKGYEKEGPKIYNMKIRPSDTFVVTFPKSGTTWTQEMVWLLSNNFDYETARAINLTQRFPFVEISIFFSNPEVKEWLIKEFGIDASKEKLFETMTKPAREFLENAPSPRFIKSHLPLSLLPPSLLDTAKVVYVARDPRDVAVSFYHHSKLMKMMGFKGDFKEYWKLFKDNLIDWTPYFPHVFEAWEKRNHPNMLFLFYEELIKDLPGAVRRVARFLGKPINEEQLARLCDHLSFDNFKNNDSVNYEELREFGLLQPDQYFIRKGKAGGWRAHFDVEMTREADQWIEQHLRGTDFTFPK